MRDLWDYSKRFRRFIMTSPTIYGWIEYPISGHFIVYIVRIKDAYKDPLEIKA